METPHNFIQLTLERRSSQRPVFEDDKPCNKESLAFFLEVSANDVSSESDRP